VERLKEHLRESWRAVQAVFHNRSLRQLQLAWAGSIIGTWAYAVALVVFAYDHGGASAVGLVALIRWLPAAIASPFAAILGDRYPRVRVMLASDLLRAVGLATMAVCVLTDAPVGVVYVLAGTVAVINTAFHPAESALLPSLAKTPEELTAANVSSSTIESLGFCVGPALGGVLLAVSSVWVVFIVTAALFLWSALMLVPLLRTTEPPLSHERPHLAEEATAGFRAIAKDPRLRLIVGLFSAQTLVNGAFGVLIAVTALQLLDLGSGGVGYLNAAVGVGGVIGGLVSLGLVGHRRLATTFGIAVAGTGAPLLLLGWIPTTAAALVAFGLIGFANIICDVAASRSCSAGLQAKCLRECSASCRRLYATIAVGAVLAPPLIHWLGVRWTLGSSACRCRSCPSSAAQARAPRRRARRPAPPGAARGDPDSRRLAAGARTACRPPDPVHASAGDELIRVDNTATASTSWTTARSRS
jgi:MFS family permease